MNLVDCHVTKVLKIEYSKDLDRYLVHVEYDSWGVKSKATLMFKNKEKADSIDKGHCFQA